MDGFSKAVDESMGCALVIIVAAALLLGAACGAGCVVGYRLYVEVKAERP
jgi:hypothetical protein